jgi:dephospho-CoA kinase
MRVVGLTGGIGMGKSTIVKLFRQARIPVFGWRRAARHRRRISGHRDV